MRFVTVCSRPFARLGLLVLALVLVATPAGAQTPADSQAVRELIQNAYVTGVFVSRDETAVRRGFHPDFVLSALDDGELIVVTLDQWLERLQLDGRPSTDAVRHVFDVVDITGDVAAVKLRLYVNDQHVYTDHLSLYKFPQGWRIVNKVFQDHD